MKTRLLIRTSLTSFILSVGLSMGALACADPAGCGNQKKQNSNEAAINDAFQRACHSSADPASVSYYIGKIDAGEMNRDEARTSIAMSCAGSRETNGCGHVSGLSDLCKSN